MKVRRRRRPTKIDCAKSLGVFYLWPYSLSCLRWVYARDGRTGRGTGFFFGATVCGEGVVGRPGEVRPLCVSARIYIYAYLYVDRRARRIFILFFCPPKSDIFGRKSSTLIVEITKRSSFSRPVGRFSKRIISCPNRAYL